MRLAKSPATRHIPDVLGCFRERGGQMNPDGRGHRFPWMPIAVFLAVAAAIAAGGRFLYLQEVAQYKKQKGDELAAIAKLKVGQIAAWREERIADGLRLTKDPFFARAAADYAADAPGQEERRRLLLSCLNTFPEAYDYLSAQLLTADGKVLAGAGESADNIGEHAHKLIHKAIAQGRPEFSDLHEAAAVQRIHMDVLIPILNGDGKEAKSAALVLLLRLNPVPYLYPLIQSWPTPSATAETVLVRRDGDSVLFLNELRHRKHTAMRLRTPLLDQYPGSRAVAGERGVFEGVDYRGEPVLAAVTQVPESTWGLVAKVDQSEIYAPLRKEARRASFSAAALILAAGLLMVYLWKRRDTALYRERHRMEMERDALVQHFDLVMRNGNDIILLADDNCRIREANDRAIAAYGYPWEELRELRLDDLRAEGAKASLPRHLERAEKEGGSVYETAQRRRNGASFPAEVSLRCIESGGAKFYQAIIRDISERKRAEKDLLCERDQAQTYLDVAGVAIIALDREGRITLINRAGWSGHYQR